MAQVEKARVFKNGRSQAVRIPVAYRFKSNEVYIWRDPSGNITLSERPQKKSWTEIFAELDAAGMADFEVERDSSPAPDRVEF